MLSQVANLQQFVRHHLGDVIDWQKQVRAADDESTRGLVEPGQRRKSDGDRAYVFIRTNYNKYWLSSLSPYVDPPPGSPFECRSLGTVEFEEIGGPETKHILGPRQDKIYIQIAAYIRMREVVEKIKEVRRQLAETNDPILANQLFSLAEQAKAAGIDLKAAGIHIGSIGGGQALGPTNVGPDNSKSMDVNPALPPVMVGTQYKASELPEGLFLGAPVVYVTPPHEHISGMFEIPGICNKINRDGTIGGVFFPDHSELMNRDHLQMYGSQEGRVVNNCWRFSQNYAAQLARLDRLELNIKNLYGTLSDHIADVSTTEPVTTKKELIAETAKLEKRIHDIDQAAGIKHTELFSALDKLKDTVLEIATRPVTSTPQAELDRKSRK